MLRHLTLIGPVIVLVIAGCGKSSQPPDREAASSEVDTAAVHSALDSLRFNFESDVIGEEIPAVKNMYTDSARILVSGRLFQGRTSIGEALEKKAGSIVTFELHPKETEIVDSSWVRESGTVQTTVVLGEALGYADTTTIHASYEALGTNIDDGWKIHRAAIRTGDTRQPSPAPIKAEANRNLHRADVSREGSRSTVDVSALQDQPVIALLFTDTQSFTSTNRFGVVPLAQYKSIKVMGQRHPKEVYHRAHDRWQKEILIAHHRYHVYGADSALGTVSVDSVARLRGGRDRLFAGHEPLLMGHGPLPDSIIESERGMHVAISSPDSNGSAHEHQLADTSLSTSERGVLETRAADLLKSAVDSVQLDRILAHDFGNDGTTEYVVTASVGGDPGQTTVFGGRIRHGQWKSVFVETPPRLSPRALIRVVDVNRDGGPEIVYRSTRTGSTRYAILAFTDGAFQTVFHRSYGSSKGSDGMALQTTPVDSLVPPPVPTPSANDRRTADAVESSEEFSSVALSDLRRERILAVWGAQGVFPLAKIVDGTVHGTIPWTGEVLATSPRYLTVSETASPQVFSVDSLTWMTTQGVPPRGAFGGQGVVSDSLSFGTIPSLAVGTSGPFALSLSPDTGSLSRTGLLPADTTLTTSQREGIAAHVAEQLGDEELPRDTVARQVSALLGPDPPPSDSLAVDVTSWNGEEQTNYLVAVEWVDVEVREFELDGGETDTQTGTGERTAFYVGHFRDGDWEHTYSTIEAHPAVPIHPDTPPAERQASNETLQVLDVTDDGVPEILQTVTSGHGEHTTTTYSVAAYREGTFKTIRTFVGDAEGLPP